MNATGFAAPIHPVKSDKPDLRTDQTMFICAGSVRIFVRSPIFLDCKTDKRSATSLLPADDDSVREQRDEPREREHEDPTEHEHRKPGRSPEPRFVVPFAKIPEHEIEESWVKARPLLAAIGAPVDEPIAL